MFKISIANTQIVHFLTLFPVAMRVSVCVRNAKGSHGFRKEPKPSCDKPSMQRANQPDNQSAPLLQHKEVSADHGIGRSDGGGSCFGK